MPQVEVPLAELAPVMRARFGWSPNYRVLCEKARSGLIPVRKAPNGRWVTDDVAACAAALGLTPLDEKRAA